MPSPKYHADKDAPYGRKADGTPAKKAGRPKGVTSEATKIACRNNLKKARETSSMTLSQNVVIPEGKNAEYVGFIQQVMTIGASVEKNNPQQMREAFFQYVNLCAQNDMKVLNMAAYAAMGIDFRRASDFRRGLRGKELQDVISDVDKVCSMYREMLINNGDVNVVWGIFAAKNYDGMKDQQDVVVAPANPLGEEIDRRALQDKYADMPD